MAWTGKFQDLVDQETDQQGKRRKRMTSHRNANKMTTKTPKHPCSMFVLGTPVDIPGIEVFSSSDDSIEDEGDKGKARACKVVPLPRKRSKTCRDNPDLLSGVAEDYRVTIEDDSDCSPERPRGKTIAQASDGKPRMLFKKEPQIDDFDSSCEEARGVEHRKKEKISKDSLQDFRTSESIEDFEEMSGENTGVIPSSPTVVRKEEKYNAPLDSAKKKKKLVKGGLAERLERIVMRETAETAIWNHKKDSALQTESEGSRLLVKVLKTNIAYGHIVVHGLCLEQDPIKVIVLVPNEHDNDRTVKAGMVLKLCLPWKKIKCSRIGPPVLVGVRRFQATNIDDALIYPPESCLESIIRAFGEEDIDKGLDANATVEKREEDYRKQNKNKDAPPILRLIVKRGPVNPMTFRMKVAKMIFQTENSERALSDGSIYDAIVSSLKKPPDKRLSIKLFSRQQEGAIIVVTMQESSVEELCRAHGCWSLEGCTLLLHQVAFVEWRTSQGNLALESFANAVIESSNQVAIVDDKLSRARKENTIFLYFKCTPLQGSVELLTTTKDAINPDSSQVFASARVMIGAKASPVKRVSLLTKCLCFVIEEEVVDLIRTTFSGIFCVCECLANDVRADLEQESTTIFTIRKLPSCFIPDMVYRCLGTGRTALYFRDALYSETAGYIADSCTVVTAVQPNCRYSSLDNHHERLSMAERNGFKFVDDELYSLIANSKSPPIPLLSRETEPGSLVILSGTVQGVNEDHAAIWNACHECKSSDVMDVENNVAYCLSCQGRRPTVTKMQLEIYLRMHSDTEVLVYLQLLQESISSLLGISNTKDFQERDSQFLLNKKFGPVAAYCRSRKPNYNADGVETIEIYTEEVQLYADSP